MLELFPVLREPNLEDECGMVRHLHFVPDSLVDAEDWTLDPVVKVDVLGFLNLSQIDQR